MMKKIILILLVMLSSLGYSQTVEEYVFNGDKAMAAGDFYTATLLYNNASELSSRNAMVLYKYAEALRQSHNYSSAYKVYARTIAVDNEHNYIDAYFYFAMMQKIIEGIDEAKNSFSYYVNIESNSKSPELLERAKYEIENANKISNIPNILTTEITHLDNTINTAYSEFGAVHIGENHFYFSSLKPVAIPEYASLLPAAYLSKIYISRNTIGGLIEPKELKGGINDKTHYNANICFTPDGKKAIFSRSSNTFPYNSELYYSEFKNNKWTKAKALSKKINVDGYTSTQANIYADKEGENGVLYFVSNQPGSIGGMDIWYSIYSKGKFQQAVNLGSNINTKGNEITPFYQDSTNTLWFSSNWHAGIGAYDVFSAKGGLSAWEEIVNAGRPINSEYNDIYFTISSREEEAYITSNRPGSFYLKGETCCNDIWFLEFNYNEVQEIVIDTNIIVDTVEILSIETKLKDLLPLSLYFHNDIPNPNSISDTTDINYKETLINYFALKSKYSQEYSKGLKGNEKYKAENDINEFFSDFIGQGFTDLQQFSEWLLIDLESGSHVRLTVQGFCSPLNTSEYNFSLAKRRIASLQNYLYEYDNGVFIPYLNDTAENGAILTIFSEPLGETQAKPFVSDNPNDQRNSVYSRYAAFERKIQIIEYVSE